MSDVPSDPKVESQPKQLPLPDRLLADGSFNVEYYQTRLENLNRLAEHHQLTRGKLLAGYEQLLRGIKEEAKAAGYSPKQVMARGGSVDDRAVALCERLLDGDSEAVLEESEEILDKIEEGIKHAVEHGRAEVARRRGDAESAAEAHRRGKRWLSLLTRVRRLRDQVRNPLPKHGLEGKSIPGPDIPVWKATHVLRLALFAMRSDMEDRKRRASKAAKIYSIPKHAVKIAFDIWEAQNGVRFCVAGDAQECLERPDIFAIPGGDSGLLRYHAYQCNGIIIICPPRHMKSTIGQAWMIREICQNPRTQNAVNHAIEEKAAENMRMISAAFDPSTAIGRRVGSIWPFTLDRVDNRGDKMRLKLPERTRDPTLVAKGVRSEIGGSNHNRQWWDDPVKSSEAEHNDVREDTKRLLTRQWLRRLQGDDSFLLVTATLWHMDDAVASLVADARAGRVPYAVSIQAAGHPRSFPPFKPVWEEEYPATRLRQIFNEFMLVGDGLRAYMAQYCADPQPEEQRVVRALRLFLSGRGAFEGELSAEQRDQLRQHAEFMENAEYDLSIDPSATSKERVSKHTDKAGIIRVGKGELVTRNTGDTGHEVRRGVVKIRVIEAEQIFAGPSEAVEIVAGRARSRRVDRVHLEVVGFATAIVEMLIQRCGLRGNQIIEHKPGGKSKKDRLKAVSPMLEAHYANENPALPGPVVEFPGVLDEEGRLVPEPATAWLYYQVLNFGSMADDHGVDALSQVLKTFYGSVLQSGSVSESVQVNDEIDEKTREFRERLQKVYTKMNRRGEERDVVEEEMALWSN